MNSKIETLLNIGIGLYAFHTTRSKKFINFFSDLNVSANYNKSISIKKNIFDAVLEKNKTKNDSIFIPSVLSEDQPVYFAIDNTDLKIDTSDGRNQQHGTATVVYQSKVENKKVCKYLKFLSSLTKIHFPKINELGVFSKNSSD